MKAVPPVEAAKLLNLSREAVMALIHAGELPAVDVRLPGSDRPRFRIDPADCQRWLESRRYQPPAPASLPQRKVRTLGVFARARAARRAQRAS